MAPNLDFSVGPGGVNAHFDVVKLQQFLNQVPPENGGPLHKLLVTGIYDKKTDNAFQNWHDSFVIEGNPDSDKQTSSPYGKRIYKPVHIPGGVDLEELLEIDFIFHNISWTFQGSKKSFNDDWSR
jgi:hypothetical protein